MRGQHRVDFRPQRCVVGTRLPEIAVARRCITRQSRVEHLRDLPPALRRHPVGSTRPLKPPLDSLERQNLDGWRHSTRVGSPITANALGTPRRMLQPILTSGA